MRNRILEVLADMERSQLWLAKKVDLSHQALDYKIKHDTFKPEEKSRVRGVLETYSHRPLPELFPEPEPSPEAA